MTQTNTDYLFQISGPVVDRNVTGPSANESAHRFGEHLSQASANARDESHLSDSGSGQKTKSISNRRQPVDSNRDHDTRSATRPLVREKTKTRSEKPTSPQENGAPNAVHDKQKVTDKADPKDENDAASNTTIVEEQSAVTQTANETMPEQTSAATLTAVQSADADASSAIDLPASSTVEHVAPKPADPAATDCSDPTPQTKTTSDEQATVAIKTEVPKTDIPTSPAAQTSEAEQPQAPAPATKQSKDQAATPPASNSKCNSDSQSDGAVQIDPSIVPASGSDAPINISQSAVTPAQTNSEPPTPPVAKIATDRDKPSHDDPHDVSSENASNSVSSNAIAQANKAAIIPVSNVVAANTFDVDGNAQPKDQKTEPIAKPIKTQGDLPAASLARPTRGNAGVGGDSQTASAGDAPAVDPARFVGRVAKAFQTAHDRGGTLQLRLSPPELGSLRLELTVKDGVMNASLQTENANARRLLLDHLPALRDRLAEQNIRVDRFDVDVRRDGTGSQADTRGSQQQAFQHQPEQPAPRRQSAPQVQGREALQTTPIAIAPSVSDAGLNLIV